ncbi:efflux RND transporter permease subunit [Streptomyces sp. HP-A2021]|uniref:efflux RND transporter permease subunit n=1 Tax=Streptomyces sp. HP-A2021 TaxID=2927875 RepID=UPI001FAE9EBA|nr:efflux RND transporter permease subunit [Streptomyces sp. HP-A2021]UOB07607.1 efflux RND transporter permease subunit [Streptomyces sp. HP-A2021]
MRTTAACRAQTQPAAHRVVLIVYCLAVQQGYGRSLKWVLNHAHAGCCCSLLGTIALNVWLYISIPKTFFPEQDAGG